jgi:large subunit ribosomal protein L6
MATATATPEVRLSRVGKRAVNIPKGVTVNLTDVKCDVQGPKGKLSVPIPDQVIAKKDGDAISFTSSAPGRDAARLQGLSRALLASAVKGAAEGYEKVLELVGTGYRAEIKGKFITLALGFSHPTNVEVPAGITAVVPPDSKGTQLVLSSADKAKLGQLAASIRDLRPPEPYGGKGIRYRGENIRRKAGKAAKGKGK